MYPHARRQPLLTLTACAALAALAAASPRTQAQSAPAAAGDAAALPEIRVRSSGEAETATGPVLGYRAKRAATATKTDTPLAETPQSVTVVTRDQMIDQGATNVQDALNYAAGVRPDAYGLDSRTDSVRVRGTEATEYLDGLRRNFNWYTSNARTDPYMLERIELLRGPSSMLFGQGSTGGILNMVSKRPLAERQGEIGIEIGNWNRRQIQGDFTGPLTADGQWLYRVVGVARKADTQVDHVNDDRVLLAPSLTLQPSGATSLTLQALYQKDETGSTSQFFPWSGTVLPNPNGKIDPSTFIGDPDWDRYDTERKSIGWLFQHRFDDRWTVRQNVRYADNDVDYRSVYGDSFSVPGGFAGDPVEQRRFGRIAYGTLNRVKTWNADQHVETRLQTGAVAHQLLAGFDYMRSTQRSRSAFDCPAYTNTADLPEGTCVGTVPLIDVYAPDYGGFTPPAFGAESKSTLTQAGLYLQNQMKFGDGWIVLAGLRHDRARNRTEGADTEKSHATTKRLGVMYQFAGGWTPYLSYSESFTPVANIRGQSMSPLRGKQWEAGLKYEPVEGGLAFNAAVYDLREKNRVQDAPAPAPITQLPDTKTRGVELELKGEVVRNIDVIANYTYTDIDEQLEGLPKNIGQVWGRWRFPIAGISGFSAGAGVRYLDAYHDGAGPQVPSVTLLDLMLAWDSPAWRVALNVNNATDKTYFASCLGRGDCWWGTERSVRLAVTRRF